MICACVLSCCLFKSLRNIADCYFIVEEKTESLHLLSPPIQATMLNWPPESCTQARPPWLTEVITVSCLFQRWCLFRHRNRTSPARGRGTGAPKARELAKCCGSLVQRWNKDQQYMFSSTLKCKEINDTINKVQRIRKTTN